MDSFCSHVEMHRFQQRILDFGEENPLELTTILLRYYHRDDIRVWRRVRACLIDISSPRQGTEAILENIIYPYRNVQKAAQSSLGENVGAHAITYATF